jgi:hypothetical protein
VQVRLVIDNVTAPTGLDAERFAAALAYADELDTTAVRQVLRSPEGRYRWIYNRVNEVELEWRRWRLRRALGFPDDAANSLLQFEAVAVETGLQPVTPVGLEAAGEATYDKMFPQGALIPKATHARITHSSQAEIDEQRYAELLAESTERRADYLAKLTDTPRWWTVPDLASAATIKACAQEVASLKPPPGSDFSGGRVHGWDLYYDALTTRSRTRYLREGPTLIAIHEDPVLVRLLSEKMGRRMYPTRCTYLPYEKGDFLGVHTDQPNCELSLLFTIDGEAGPLRSYFDETLEKPAWLDNWVREQGNLPEGGEDYTYGAREGYAITGRVVPHARPTQNEPALIGALFYSGLI